jgi:phage gp36-like protein
MPYATVTDLQDRLGEARLMQLTDLADPPIGLVDTAVAQKALDDAEAEIDGYLVGRYALPLSPAPGVLRVHACTIAHYRLLGSAVDEATKDDYKATRQFLTMVAKGDVLLTAPDQAVAPAGLGMVMFNGGAKVMSRDAYAGEDA